MRFLLPLATLSCVCLVSCSALPQRGKDKIVQQIYELKGYAPPDFDTQGIKGSPTRLRPITEKPLRKGEYHCGDKICKLKPGIIPPGCGGGLCQYPLGPPGSIPHYDFDEDSMNN